MGLGRQKVKARERKEWQKSMMEALVLLRAIDKRIGKIYGKRNLWPETRDNELRNGLEVKSELR